MAFLNAQPGLNEIAPERRRGEVAAAFIAGVYALLAIAVVAAGLAALAAATAAWQVVASRPHPS